MEVVSWMKVVYQIFVQSNQASGAQPWSLAPFLLPPYLRHIHFQ